MQTGEAAPIAWVVRNNVPVLDVFKEDLGNGKSVTSTVQKMRRIADRMNKIYRETGDECPIVVGHTTDDAPEWEQPPIVGYACDMYVGKQNGKPVLMAKQWKLYPESKVGGETLTADEVMRRFPRRSPEWHTKDDILDPISILGATSPMRHLGLVRCSHKGGGSPVNDLQSFLGALKDLIAQFSGENPATEPDGDETVQLEGAAGAPTSSNTYAPGDEETFKMSNDTNEKVRLERDQLHRRLARLEELDKQRKAEFDAELVKMRRARREADFLKLDMAEGLVFDVAEELDAVQHMDDSAYEQHLVRMRKRYQRIPTGEFVKTARVVEGTAKPTATREQAIKAAELARTTGKDYGACLAEAMGS